MNGMAGARDLRILFVAMTAMLMLAVPSVSYAKSGYVTFPAERRSQMVIQGTHGFKVTIVRIGGRVELTASKQNSSAIYVIRPAKEPADRIKAVFPGLGRISARFHPSGEPQHSAAFCKGRGSIKQVGIFRGKIKFEGEQGFTKVDASYAQGHIYQNYKEVCKRSAIGRATDALGYSLAATARWPNKQIVFRAFKATDSVFAGNTYHFVSFAETGLGMTIVRVALAPAQTSSFVIDGPSTRPNSSTVTPPSPFSGTASFHAPEEMPAEWQGTLAVDLPGAGTVQLTGPSYKAELCLNKRCVGTPPTTASQSSEMLGERMAKRGRES
jgi:hypothetical protein